jgi:hypothetical protein
MNPNDIKLEDMNKAFEYEKLARDIDALNSMDDLKNLSKCYLKMYLKQQEVISKL